MYLRVSFVGSSVSLECCVDVIGSPLSDRVVEVTVLYSMWKMVLVKLIIT
jgi:hypothetical protein